MIIYLQHDKKHDMVSDELLKQCMMLGKNEEEYLIMLCKKLEKMLEAKQ
jgi:hypothetical protein